MAANGDGHTKGDIKINAPTDDVAKALNDFFRKGKCQTPPSKRGTNLDKRIDNIVDCLVNDLLNIITAMRGNGVLSGLAQPAMQVAQNFTL